MIDLWVVHEKLHHRSVEEKTAHDNNEEDKNNDDDEMIILWICTLRLLGEPGDPVHFSWGWTQESSTAYVVAVLLILFRSQCYECSKRHRVISLVAITQTRTPFMRDTSLALT